MTRAVEVSTTAVHQDMLYLRFTVQGSLVVVDCEWDFCSYPWVSSDPTPAWGASLDIYADVYMEFLGGSFYDPTGYCGCDEYSCTPILT